MCVETCILWVCVCSRSRKKGVLSYTKKSVFPGLLKLYRPFLQQLIPGHSVCRGGLVKVDVSSL